MKQLLFLFIASAATICLCAAIYYPFVDRWDIATYCLVSFIAGYDNCFRMYNMHQANKYKKWMDIELEKRKNNG